MRAFCLVVVVMAGAGLDPNEVLAQIQPPGVSPSSVVDPFTPPPAGMCLRVLSRRGQ